MAIDLLPPAMTGLDLRALMREALAEAEVAGMVGDRKLIKRTRRTTPGRDGRQWIMAHEESGSRQRTRRAPYPRPPCNTLSRLRGGTNRPYTSP